MAHNQQHEWKYVCRLRPTAAAKAIMLLAAAMLAINNLPKKTKHNCLNSTIIHHSGSKSKTKKYEYIYIYMYIDDAFARPRRAMYDVYIQRMYGRRATYTCTTHFMRVHVIPRMLCRRGRHTAHTYPTISYNRPAVPARTAVRGRDLAPVTQECISSSMPDGNKSIG